MLSLNTRSTVILQLIILVFVTLWMETFSSIGLTTEAEPSWARKYNAQCTLCHTTYPRLNRTGYDFRRLGYRLPGEASTSNIPPGPSSDMIASAHEPFVVKPTEYTPQPESAESAQGKAIFDRLDCFGCHSIAGKGGTIGPPLDGVGGRRDKIFLIAHITNPEAHVKEFPELHDSHTNRMPHPHAGPEEVQLIVVYLLTLPVPPAGFRMTPHTEGGLKDSGPPDGHYQPAPETETSRAGEKLYYDLGCASCHSIAGNGGEFGPKLDGIGARRGRNFISAHITNAQVHAEQFPGEHAGDVMMPPTEATAEQIAQITEFLMTLPMQETVEVKKNRIQDYIGVSYAPAMEVESHDGENETQTETRELIIYAAGPLGRYFSFFVQPLPASEEEGFVGKFEMAQGLINYGSSNSFLQVRFGQMFNLRGSGFGGTDRGLTETQPLIFAPVDGFNAGGLGRGVSAEYTLSRTTTLKAFGVSNEPAEEEEEESEQTELASLFLTQDEEPPVPELQRSRTVGFILEKVFGEKGLSGLQVEFAAGNTPVFADDAEFTTLKFQRYFFLANKTFVDAKNFERVNAIIGISFFRDDHLLDAESDRNSHGYGFFAEVSAIPVINHFSVYGRYDQLRPTTMISDNTVRAATAGAIYDIVKYLRLSFEYQRFANEDTANKYRFALQINY